MLAFRQHWFFKGNWQSHARLSFNNVIIPGVAGCIMVCASVLPWLNDPLGEAYTAWELPIDIGWQFRIGIFSYGLLCLCCAGYAFLVAYANWNPFKGSDYFVNGHGIVGVLCIIPVALFFLQYLYIDVQGINQLAQHEIQLLLVQQHFGYIVPRRFGYNVNIRRISIDPSALPTLDVSTFQGRFYLIMNQVSVGLLLPCLSAWMLIDYKRLLRQVASKKQHKLIWFASILTLVLLVVLGRAPAGMVCEYQANTLLAAGNYEQALGWLDSALVLNPALDQVAYYHIERGQALYFLRSDKQSDDSRAYLAFTYRRQGDLLDAYQQLLAIWQSHHTTPSWVVDEMNNTLEALAEYNQPLKLQPVVAKKDDTALVWLQLLVQVDPANVYSRYTIGRIQYERHDYTGCMAQMARVIQLSPNADVQSSAYTYIAFSEAGMGDYVDERKNLFKAVELDPFYYNNTAREALSGLR